MLGSVMEINEGFVRESIKRICSAFAYEHSGEMLSRSRKNLVLSGSSTGVSAKEKESTVLNQAADSK